MNSLHSLVETCQKNMLGDLRGNIGVPLNTGKVYRYPSALIVGQEHKWWTGGLLLLLAGDYGWVKLEVEK